MFLGLPHCLFLPLSIFAKQAKYFILDKMQNQILFFYYKNKSFKRLPKERQLHNTRLITLCLDTPGLFKVESNGDHGL